MSGARERTAGRLRTIRRLSVGLAAGAFAAFAGLVATSSHGRSGSGTTQNDRVVRQSPADDDGFFQAPAPSAGSLGGSTDTAPVGRSGGS